MLFRSVSQSRYWLDKDNYVYVVGGEEDSPVIVTLYEEDFGWGKEKNRYLVLSQVKDLERLKEALDASTSSYQQEEDARAKRIEDINSQMGILEYSLQALEAKKSVILAESKEGSSRLIVEKQKFVRELRKLFSDKESKRMKVW